MRNRLQVSERHFHKYPNVFLGYLDISEIFRKFRNIKKYLFFLVWPEFGLFLKTKLSDIFEIFRIFFDI